MKGEALSVYPNFDQLGDCYWQRKVDFALRNSGNGNSSALELFGIRGRNRNYCLLCGLGFLFSILLGILANILNNRTQLLYESLGYKAKYLLSLSAKIVPFTFLSGYLI